MDNPALLAAAERGGPLIPVLIWAQEEEKPWSLGEASKWWLHQSLTSLQSELEAYGSRLIVRKGPSLFLLRKEYFEWFHLM